MHLKFTVRFRGLRGPAVWASLIFAALFPSSAGAETLIVQGSTTFNRLFMEPQQSEIEAATGHVLTVIPNKSMPGLIALLEGRAHLAMISAPLESEIQSLQKAMPGLPLDQLKVHPVLASRVAIAVHPSNSVRKTTLHQIREVLLGRITNWAALGGSSKAIRIVLVGGGGGVTTVVESELLGGSRVNLPNVTYMKTPVQLVQVVEQEPAAMGFAQLALLKQRELPELGTEKPIEQVLSFVTFGPPAPAAQAVINAARRIAEKQM
jgi:ABC-type phosphate transport system substrate-binding protein